MSEMYKYDILPKVLIVDDDPKIIDIIGSFLGKDFKRQVATNGENALKILRNSSVLPDLILLDLVMPGMGGYEVCSEIKKDKRLKDIPIIFISALLEIDSIEKAFEMGGIDYIEKPFTEKEVKMRVINHIDAYRKNKELEKNNVILKTLIENKIKEISESQMATIFALVKLTESRDDDTGKHLDRVQAFSRLILEKMQNKDLYHIDTEYIEAVEKASVLHDIGKIGIEDSVLLKPGTLTVKEHDRIKDHTIIGSQTLREVHKKYPGNKFIELGIEIAHYHHERWDGSGYPEGLMGGEIPLSARVVALADLYDALRSKRIYKESFGHEITCKIIKEASGKHLEPIIVEVFLKYAAEFDNIYIQLSDKS